jgi:putative flavoprotein involved in K+ transport
MHTDDTTTEWHDTVVIGVGQTGLAVGYELSKRHQDYVILDEHERVGDVWRERYDSLRLYTPAKYDRLPGMAFPAEPYHFPTGAEMGDFLEAYAARFELPIVGGVRVDGVHADGDDYLVTAGDRRFRTANVVVAAGGKHAPFTPKIADELDPGIRQLHSDDYRNPDQLLPGDVLVVGASHSGSDLALEFAAKHHTVLAGPKRGEIPFDIEGRPARVILRALWFAANHVLTLRTPMGRKMRTQVRSQGAPLLRVKSDDLAAAGVDWVTEHVAGTEDGLPVLESGRVLDVRNVIWCTGFHHDLSWLHLPILDEDGWPLQRNGIVESRPGIYFNGLVFQSAFASMLVGGAGRDAKGIAQHITARGKSRPATRPAIHAAEPASRQ